jgi:hypothetical protein
MSKEELLDVWVAPLLFPEAESSKKEGKLPDCESVLRYLCKPEADFSIESITNRYQEISEKLNHLSIVPAEKKILNKLIWSLKHAIGSYMVGNYLGTISLCGLVAEMATILLFEILNNFNSEGIFDKKSKMRALKNLDRRNV